MIRAGRDKTASAARLSCDAAFCGGPGRSQERHGTIAPLPRVSARLRVQCGCAAAVHGSPRAPLIQARPMAALAATVVRAWLLLAASVEPSKR
jgi:hypothetical protein